METADKQTRDPHFEVRAWDTLLPALKYEKCILMLGPDAFVPANCAGETGRPLMEEFARALAQQLHEDPQYSAPILEDFSDFSHVAQVYKHEVGDMALRSKTVKFFTEQKLEAFQIIKDLASLPFKLTITTVPGNFRTIFQDARGVTFYESWLHYKYKSQEEFFDASMAEHPVIYHLYGSIRDPMSLVVAESDLLDFLVSLVGGNVDLPNEIMAELLSEENCFLFVGFGFRHWYLRILLHVLFKTAKKNPGFALETFEKQEKWIESTKYFFKTGHRIHFFDMDLGSFCRELKSRHERQSRSPATSEEPRYNAPTVFLCHTRNDAEHAKQLYKKLKESGLRPWLDQFNLRGGDDWPRHIRRVITEEIDYFVVLHSKALLAKVEGFVIKEIKLALERMQGIRDDFKFVFPTRIEVCDYDPAFADLQYIDIFDELGFEELVGAIQRDDQRRRKKK